MHQHQVCQAASGRRPLRGQVGQREAVGEQHQVRPQGVEDPLGGAGVGQARRRVLPVVDVFHRQAHVCDTQCHALGLQPIGLIGLGDGDRQARLVQGQCQAVVDLLGATEAAAIAVDQDSRHRIVNTNRCKSGPRKQVFGSKDRAAAMVSSGLKQPLLQQTL
jgi:hypothetical protein